MNSTASEAEVLAGLIPQLEAEGYEVFIEPRPPLAPPFLANVQADAIAIRSDKKLLIEVVRESTQARGKLERLRQLIKDQPGWELRAVLISPATSPVSLPLQTQETIVENVQEIQKLLAGGFIKPALLLGWASFEAAARATMPEQFRKPQTPGRLVDLLAGAGYLTPSEADNLRQLAKSRNAFVHGQLDIPISEDDVQQLISVLNTLLVIRTAPSAPKAV
jgi:uncharacterized protein YutE (UPF0331/DUF86 family)